MNIKKCCMVGCNNVESQNGGDDNRKLYVFPKDFNLCMLWVQNSGQPEYFEDFAFAGAQPFLNRYICSDHFNDTDFVKSRDKTSGLLPGAVPNLNFTFPKVEVKEEHIDSEFAEALAETLISETELVNEIKVEKFENDNCDEVNASFSFSSTDDSCNDLLGVNLSTNTTEIYRETEEDKELSDEFFRKYQNAVRGNRSTGRRANETEEERALRLKREALRAKIRRSQETEEQKRIRRMKNALRAAFRRKNETPEQRELRKKKDMLRAQRRRKAETEAEARIRRYNDAVRAAFRRNNETEEQRMERKMKDIMRAAKRRSMETPEQREMRLRKDRERASRRRMLKKIAEQMSHLNGVPEYAQTEVPIKIDPANASISPSMVPALDTVVTQCNESSSLERLQQVLEFIEDKTNKTRRKRRTRAEKAAESNERPVHYIDLLINPNIVPSITNSVNDKSETLEDDIFHENNEDSVNCLNLKTNSSNSSSSQTNISGKSVFIGGSRYAEEARDNENSTSFLKLVGNPNSVVGTVENIVNNKEIVSVLEPEVAWG